MKSNFNGTRFGRRRQAHGSLCNRFLYAVVGGRVNTNFSSIVDVPTRDRRFPTITLVKASIRAREFRCRVLIVKVRRLRSYSAYPVS